MEETIKQYKVEINDILARLATISYEIRKLTKAKDVKILIEDVEEETLGGEIIRDIYLDELIIKY